MSAVATVTVQNSVGVQRFHQVPPTTLVAQIEAVVTDIGADATKAGMLGSAAMIVAATGAIERLGLDPMVDDVLPHLEGTEAGSEVITWAAQAGEPRQILQAAIEQGSVGGSLLLALLALGVEQNVAHVCLTSGPKTGHSS